MGLILSRSCVIGSFWFILGTIRSVGGLIFSGVNAAMFEIRPMCSVLYVAKSFTFFTAHAQPLKMGDDFKVGILWQIGHHDFFACLYASSPTSTASCICSFARFTRTSPRFFKLLPVAFTSLAAPLRTSARSDRSSSPDLGAKRRVAKAPTRIPKTNVVIVPGKSSLLMYRSCPVFKGGFV